MSHLNKLSHGIYCFFYSIEFCEILKFLRDADFCADVGAKRFKGSDLISFGAVRLRVELCHGPFDERVVKPEVIRKTAIKVTSCDKSSVEIVF